jgi:tetratricopeptide (TPR) repeat protein
VDQRRYRGLARSDKTVRWAVEELATVEGRRKAGVRPTTAQPESLRRLAGLLTELGWDDLAALARREELMVYRELNALRPGAFADQLTETMAALRANLVDDGRYEEALAVIDEQLAFDRHRSGQVAAREAGEWRTVLLSRLGRHEEAVESAGAAVAEIRGRLERGAAVDLKFCHALTAYAEQLDRAGRVTEAAGITAEALECWRGRNDSRYEFARTVDQLSDRLARSGRAEQAYTVIAGAWQRLRPDAARGELADVWHNLGVRLLALGHPKKALAAANQAVKRHRVRVHVARERHRAVEARDDWDDDHRYAEWYLLERRQEELAESQEQVRKAEQALRHALLALAACLQQLNRADEATTAHTEATALGQAPEDAT